MCNDHESHYWRLWQFGDGKELPNVVSMGVIETDTV